MPIVPLHASTARLSAAIALDPSGSVEALASSVFMAVDAASKAGAGYVVTPLAVGDKPADFRYAPLLVACLEGFGYRASYGGDKGQPGASSHICVSWG